MLAIAVELLTGRYTATQFNNRNRAEWPPHPARLFSAMVATWADNDEPDPGEREVLRWLEDQDPPELRMANGHERKIVTHYVPVNDTTALTRDVSGTYHSVALARQAVHEAQSSGTDRDVQKARSALERAEAKAAADTAKAGRATGKVSASVLSGVLQMLPENRGKQGRTYPSVTPEDPHVWFIWRQAVPGDQQFELLDGLLARVGRIGHSSTLVSCRAVREAPEPTLVPARGSNGSRLRVPRTGSISALESAFAIHKGEEPRTLPAGMVSYAEPGVDKAIPSTPLLGGDWYVMGFNKQRGLPNAVQALALTRAARGALMKHGDQPPAPFLSGHREPVHAGERTVPLEGPHLAVVPLINAGNAHSDGTVYGIGLVLPRDCGDADRAALHRALRSWEQAGFPLLRWHLEDMGVDRTEPDARLRDNSLSRKRRTMTRNYWCRPSRRWATVTPVALDRFPGKIRSAEPALRDRAEAEAEVAIERACVFAGLVDTPDDVDVAIRLDSPLVGLPASPAGRPRPGSRKYPGYQTGTGVPRVCVHAEIKFREPVNGPVLIGAGRYLGYGLCLPRGEAE